MIRLRLPGTLSHRDAAVRLVDAACKLVTGADAEFHDQVVSAFGEAFNNIAIHGYRDRAPGDVEIEIVPNAHAITIQVRDDGAGFDVAATRPPDLEALPESGLGLYIIRSFMDEVVYRNGSPNVLTMRRRVRGARARESEGTP